MIRVKGDPSTAQNLRLELIEGTDSVETGWFFFVDRDRPIFCSHRAASHSIIMTRTLHVTSRTRLSPFQFSAWRVGSGHETTRNIENVGVVWGRG